MKSDNRKIENRKTNNCPIQAYCCSNSQAPQLKNSKTYKLINLKTQKLLPCQLVNSLTCQLKNNSQPISYIKLGISYTMNKSIWCELKIHRIFASSNRHKENSIVLLTKKRRKDYEKDYDDFGSCCSNWFHRLR